MQMKTNVTSNNFLLFIFPGISSHLCSSISLALMLTCNAFSVTYTLPSKSSLLSWFVVSPRKLAYFFHIIIPHRAYINPKGVIFCYSNEMETFIKVTEYTYVNAVLRLSWFWRGLMRSICFKLLIF